MLSEIHAVKVGVYTARHTPFRQGLESMPPRVQELLTRKNWEVALKVREGREVAWLLYHIRGQTVDQMHLVVLSDAGLNLGAFRGPLGALDRPGSAISPRPRNRRFRRLAGPPRLRDQAVSPAGRASGTEATSCRNGSQRA